MNTVFIYALNDPDTGRTRYIGKTRNLNSRFKDHLKSAKKGGTHRANWINCLLKMGKAPILEALDRVPETEWIFWEREWIRLYRALGFNLVNGTEGGEGGGMKGKKHSLETRARMSAERIGKPKPLGFAEKQSARQTGRKLPAGWCKKMSEVRLGTKRSAESIQKQSNALKGRKHSAETIEKQRAGALAFLARKKQNAPD